MYYATRQITALFAVLLLTTVGCENAPVEETLDDAEAKVEEVTETVSDKVTDVVDASGDAAKELGEKAKELGEKTTEKAKELGEKTTEKAKELGEKAMGYLAPLKEKFGSLEALKDKPEELKAAVSELIQSIEAKTEEIELPEAVSNALTAGKEKLVELKTYLEGEVDQAKIEEHLQGVMSAVKGKFGMATE